MQVQENHSSMNNSLPRQAIRHSVDLDRDLIGIALESDPPVVRLGNYQVLKKQQESKASGKKGGASQPRVKEVKFKSSIEGNDYERRIGDLVRFLEKGHDCIVRITVKGRDFAQNENVAMDLSNQVLEQVVEYGKLTGSVKLNAFNNQANFRIQTFGAKK